MSRSLKGGYAILGETCRQPSVDRWFVEPVRVLAEHFGNIGDGEDV
jgi:hypothetical protein